MKEPEYRCPARGCEWYGRAKDAKEELLHEIDQELDEDGNSEEYRLVCPICGCPVEEVQDWDLKEP